MIRLWRTKLGKAAFAVVLTWFVVADMYVMVTHPAIEREAISWIFKIPMYSGAVVGLAADVVFNASVGSVIYAEIPREWTFTARSSRHLRSDGFRRDRAVYWCEELDKFQPGHCDWLGESP